MEMRGEKTLAGVQAATAALLRKFDLLSKKYLTDEEELAALLNPIRHVGTPTVYRRDCDVDPGLLKIIKGHVEEIHAVLGEKLPAPREFAVQVGGKDTDSIEAGVLVFGKPFTSSAELDYRVISLISRAYFERLWLEINTGKPHYLDDLNKYRQASQQLWSDFVHQRSDTKDKITALYSGNEQKHRDRLIADLDVLDQTFTDTRDKAAEISLRMAGSQYSLKERKVDYELFRDGAGMFGHFMATLFCDNPSVLVDQGIIPASRDLTATQELSELPKQEVVSLLIGALREELKEIQTIPQLSGKERSLRCAAVATGIVSYATFCASEFSKLCRNINPIARISMAMTGSGKDNEPIISGSTKSMQRFIEKLIDDGEYSSITVNGGNLAFAGAIRNVFLEYNRGASSVQACESTKHVLYDWYLC